MGGLIPESFFVCSARVLSRSITSSSPVSVLGKKDDFCAFSVLWVDLGCEWGWVDEWMMVPWLKEEL